jgi:hypothetical protein
MRDKWQWACNSAQVKQDMRIAQNKKSSKAKNGKKAAHDEGLIIESRQTIPRNLGAKLFSWPIRNHARANCGYRLRSERLIPFLNHLCLGAKPQAVL